MKKEGVQIGSRDFWFKVVDFLSHSSRIANVMTHIKSSLCPLFLFGLLI